MRQHGEELTHILIRTPGCVAHWEGHSLKVRVRAPPVSHYLNESAAAVWLGCDGATCVTKLVKELADMYKGHAETIAKDVPRMVDDLHRRGLIQYSGILFTPRPLLFVSFAGFGNAFPVGDNYFTEMLTHRFDVVVVESDFHQPPDIVFCRAPAIGQVDLGFCGSALYRILVNTLDQDPDFSVYDYVFSSRDVPHSYEPLHTRLPGWALFINWQAYQKSVAAYGHEAILEGFSPEKVCRKFAEALFEFPSVADDPNRAIITSACPPGIEPEPHGNDQAIPTDGLNAASGFPHPLSTGIGHRDSSAPSQSDRRSRVPKPNLDESPWRIDVGNASIDVLLHMEQPTLMLLDNVLSKQECQALIEAARGRMNASRVVDLQTGGSCFSNVRTSQGMFFKRGETGLIERIEERLANLVNWPVEYSEGIQVLNYAVGQEYQPHYDYFDLQEPGTPRLLARGGQRVATLVMYLESPLGGGGTYFPDIGLVVGPKRGAAVFFAWEEAVPQNKTRHGSLPVTAGDKWVATKWFRESRYP